MRVAITTALHSDLEAEARACAERFGLPWVERGRRSLEAAARDACAQAILVLSRSHSTIVVCGEECPLDPAGGGTVLHRWSAGMGFLRMKRALGGSGCGPTGDPFLEAAGIRPGDSVLDCTLGLGADALVAAAAAGADGRVVAVEASPVLAAWVAAGLARLGAEAARRVEVHAGDHAKVLASLPERSFDVVLFDPMFRHPRAEPGGFDAVRAFADPRPLSPAALARARLVSRRWVVVKDGAPGWDLARLDLTPLPSARGAHRYYARVGAGGP